jgi:hypothetical protein
VVGFVRLERLSQKPQDGRFRANDAIPEPYPIAVKVVDLAIQSHEMAGKLFDGKSRSSARHRGAQGGRGYAFSSSSSASASFRSGVSKPSVNQL